MDESEAKWLKSFLENILLRMKPTSSVSMHYVCQSTITTTKNQKYNGKNVHIQLRHKIK